MAIKSCPKCKNLLVSKIIRNKIILKCEKCDFFKQIKIPSASKEKIKPPEPVGKGIMKNKNLFATYKHKCEKCGYDYAQVLDLGIFYSDEDNLILLQCGRCGYSERVGRKTS